MGEKCGTCGGNGHGAGGPECPECGHAGGGWAGRKVYGDGSADPLERGSRECRAQESPFHHWAGRKVYGDGEPWTPEDAARAFGPHDRGARGAWGRK